MNTFFILTALAALFVIPAVFNPSEPAGKPENRRSIPGLWRFCVSKRTAEAISGFAGGLLTSFICFSLLADPFRLTGALFTLIFLSIGILTANILTPPPKILLFSSSLTAAVFSFVQAPNMVACAALSLASGVLLSLSCDAIIPGDRASITSLAALPGFVAGILALTYL